MQCGKIYITSHEMITTEFSLAQMLYLMGAPTESLTDCENPTIKRDGFVYAWELRPNGDLVFAWQEGKDFTAYINTQPTRRWRDYEPTNA